MASHSGAIAESLCLESTLPANRRSLGQLALTGSRHAVPFQDQIPENQPRRRRVPLHRADRNPPPPTRPRRAIPLTTCSPLAEAPGLNSSMAFWITQSFSESSRANSRSKTCNAIPSAGQSADGEPPSMTPHGSFDCAALRSQPHHESTAVGNPTVSQPRKPLAIERTLR